MRLPGQESGSGQDGGGSESHLLASLSSVMDRLGQAATG